MDTAWDVDVAAAAIGRALRAQPATAAVLTFDGRGVTGHLNHAATAAAVARVALAAAEGVTCWRLRSLPWYLAWLGPAALVVLPAVGKRGAVLASPAGPAAVLRGLAAHASQRTWWRVAGAWARTASWVSVVEATAALMLALTSVPPTTRGASASAGCSGF